MFRNESASKSQCSELSVPPSDIAVAAMSPRTQENAEDRGNAEGGVEGGAASGR